MPFPSRTEILRRFVAWVLGVPVAELQPDISDERLYRILAGDRRDDPAHLETLRCMSARGLEVEAPFAAAYHRGYVLTPEDLAARAQVGPMPGIDRPLEADGSPSGPPAAPGAARVAAGVPAGAYPHPDEVRELLRGTEPPQRGPQGGLR